MNVKSPYPSLQQAWVIFAIYLAAAIAIGLLIGALGNLIGTENMSVSNFVGYNISMLFVIWFAWRNMKQGVERVLQFNSIPAILFPLLLVVTLSLAIFLDPLTNLIPMPEVVEELFAMLSKRDIWTFLMVCIMGPVLEEVLFRGLILDGFLKRYKPWKAIFWSAFLFGLFHLNPWQFIPGFLIGMLIGYVYFKTRSLTTSILVHVVNNTFSYVLMYIYGSDITSFRDLFENPRDYAILLATGTLIFILSLTILYKILSKNDRSWTFNSTASSS